MVWTVGAVFLFSSCTKVIHIPIPEIESKLVVNCFFTPDSIFTLYVGKSVPIFDDKPRVLEDATVFLFQNDVCVDTLQYSEGLYLSTYRATTQEKYSIKVQCPGLDTAYAENSIPPAPEQITGSFCDSVLWDEDGYPVSQAKIEISDDPYQENYYEILLKIFYWDPYDSLWHNNGDMWYYSDNPDPVLENEGLIPYDPSTILFSDELFNGTRYTLTINYQQTELRVKNNLIVCLRAVSKDYYQYKKQLIKHLYNQESDIWDGTGNPVQMYSNIQGGYGIFAGYSEIRDTLLRNNK